MKKATKKEPVKDIAESYNRYKLFEGKQYTGMKIGRSHTWYYDKGEWKETKITPDLWNISYAVTKRRAGKAPEGSGVPVGTEYHWYILAHQMVTKLDANSYSTAMQGLKYKIAHKRADKPKWNISEATRKKHLIRFLQNVIDELERESPGEAIKPDAEKEAAKKPVARKRAGRKPLAKKEALKTVRKTRKVREPSWDEA